MPYMGQMDMDEVTADTLEAFRMHLVEECKLALKTARNVIDGSLRAMFRDCGRELRQNPFDELPLRWWPRIPRDEPDPFTEKERDEIVKHGKRSRRAEMGPCGLLCASGHDQLVSDPGGR
jgi:hypothetical protein